MTRYESIGDLSIIRTLDSKCHQYLDGVMHRINETQPQDCCGHAPHVMSYATSVNASAAYSCKYTISAKNWSKPASSFIVRMIGEKRWCPEPESNQRHADFQSKPIFDGSIACSGTSVKPPIRNQTVRGDLSNASAIIVAAQWLADQGGAADLSPSTICEKFNLTAYEAHNAADIARRFRICRRAFG